MNLMKKGIQNLCVADGKILIGDNSSIQIQEMGYLYLIPNGSSGTYTCEVLYVPNLHYNLLSICELHKLGLWIEFVENQCTIWETATNQVIVTWSEDNGI